MSRWSAKRFNAEAQTLANIIAHQGGDFTIGEAEHWSRRLTDAYDVDFAEWHRG